MSDVKINYYRVLKNNTPMWDIDETNGVALIVKTEQGKKWTVDKDMYVKSFGQTRNLRTQDQKKEQFLVLVNGNGVSMKDIELYKDEVDDCGCDGNPIATPTDLEKANETVEYKKLDKESAYVSDSGTGKSRFDKKSVACFFAGASIGAAIMWFSTKEKKKTIIGAIAGGVLGVIIGYFIGRGGIKKTGVVENIDDISKKANTDNIENVEAGAKTDSDKQGFFQLGQSYDFSIPYPVYALLYEENTFFVAEDSKKGNKAVIKAGSKIAGKLVEMKDANFFVPDPKTKKITKIKSNKPLPFLDLGNNIFIPLAVVEPTSMFSSEQVKNYLSGQGADEDVYVKGRYAGKKSYLLMCNPAYTAIIKQVFKT